MIPRLINAVFSSPRRWLLAGVVGTFVLAIFMEGVARIVLGGPMKPAMLICQALGWGADLLWLGEILHYALGLIVFPLGFVLLRTIIDGAPAVILGAGWGVLLWIGAGAVIAPLAGAGFFFGGGSIMLASLVAHIAYGVVLGTVYGNEPAIET